MNLFDEVDALRSRATRAETPCGDGALVWHRWGPATGRPVVLLHGGSGSWTHWLRNIDALADAGSALGLDPGQALRLAVSTVEGAALMAAQSDETPSVLADRVASPGGVTREGLNVLDEGQALKTLLEKTLDAAARKNAAMAAAARG